MENLEEPSQKLAWFWFESVIPKCGRKENVLTFFFSSETLNYEELGGTEAAMESAASMA